MTFLPTIRRLGVFVCMALCLGTAVYGQKPESKPETLDPLEKEIARLTEQKENLAGMVKAEPDGKQRHRIKEALLKSDELIHYLQQAQRIRNNKKRQEITEASEETRTLLEDLIADIFEAKRQQETPPQTQPAKQIPEIYETRNDFRIRLRMPE